MARAASLARRAAILRQGVECPALDQTYDPQWVVDVSASFKPSEQWTLTLGADNVLDSHPDRTRATSTGVNAWGQMPYSNYSPAGFNGAYVYARVGYKW